jgi:CheY-like chemotaxis protein
MKKGYPCTILLADDDAEDRQLFKEALDETKKADLVIAKDGLDLMSILYKMVKLPDAIFLDLNMPRKDGHECLREIKKNEKFTGIPVIIYSTTKSKAQIDASYDEGANLYITKPDSFTKLKQVISEVLQMKSIAMIPRPERSKFVLAV